MSKPEFDTFGVSWSILFWGTLIISVLIIISYVLFRILKGIGKLSAKEKLFSLVYLCVAITAIYFTWKHMLLMTQQDIDESGFKDFYTWFVSKKTHREQSLFFQAYQSVTDTPQGWWYSSQVLFFVLSMIAFFTVETSSLPSLKFGWALVWLGYGIAISACLPLFFIYLMVAKRTDASKVRKGADFILIICTLAAIVSAVFIPITSGKVFNRNIIFGHVITLVPLIIPSSKIANPSDKVKIYAIYAFLAGICFNYYLISTLNFWQFSDFDKFANDLLTFGWKHHAQASISFDWVFITIECCLFYLFEGGFTGLLFVLLTPLCSVSSTFPLFLIWREYKLYSENDVTKKTN